MKSLTAILAIAFTLLAMKPGIDMLYDAVSWNASCSIECCDDKQSGCEGKACNPFQACNTCVLICPTGISTTLEFMIASNDHGFGERPSFVSEYDSEFWQPPKIV
jgi:hypothetical protein